MSANEREEGRAEGDARRRVQAQRGAGQPEGTERHGRQKGRGAVDPDLGAGVFQQTVSYCI